MINLKKNIELYLPLLISIIIGSLCYFFDYIIKENMNFITIIILIFIFSYYLQQRLIFPVFNIKTTTMDCIGNSITIVIHTFVIWTILLNIF